MSGERARLEALLDQAEAFASDIVRAYGHFDSWSEDDLGEMGRETLLAITSARSKLAQGVEARVIAREMAAHYVGATTQQGLLALAGEKTLSGRARRAVGASPGAVALPVRRPRSQRAKGRGSGELAGVAAQPDTLGRGGQKS
jgi:hypothetical protein